MTDRRVPPHDPQAEADVIGSMLLSRPAVFAAGELVGVEDFYVERHARTFEAMMRLVERGDPVDEATVSAEARVDREALRAVVANTPASANVSAYAKLVADLARSRRAIGFAGDLAEVGYAHDRDGIDKLMDEFVDRLATPLERPAVRTLDQLLADDTTRDIAKPWLVPGMMRRRERYVLTGGEGWGKSTYLRQWAYAVSCGLHPILAVPMGVEPASTLIVDLQDDEADLRAELEPMRVVAADRHVIDGLTLIARPQGMNLLSAMDARWLESIIRHVRPHLVAIGPLRKMYRPDRGARAWDEEVVAELQNLLDEWRVMYDFALMIEAHSGQDRDTWRVRGSSLWYDWPEFGHGFDPQGTDPREVEVKKWRADRRVRGRVVPHRLFGGGDAFPWDATMGDRERMTHAAGLDWIYDPQEAMEIGQEIF